MTHRTKAYAKVNIHLEVLKKRHDSYHNIFSINANIGLYDLIILNEDIIEKNSIPEIEINTSGGSFEDTVRAIPVEENLITKAIKSYLGKINKSGKFTIIIEKNIPTGAGLAGGSSDAAAILRLLNNIFNNRGEGLKEEELLKIGLGLGADIPFCLTGGFCVCEGIGEIITKIEGGLNHWVILANNGIHVDTGDAFKALNRDSNHSHKSIDLQNRKDVIAQSFKNNRFESLKIFLKNDFEEPIFRKYPEIKQLKEDITEYEPEYAAMTGSGSTVFGIFKSIEKAKLAQKNLLAKAKHVILTKFIQ